VAQHQSKCSIFANQQLKVSNIFLCSCCFRPTSTWLSFRRWPTLINSFTDCFHWAKLPTLFRKFCNSCLVSKTKFLQCLDPSFIFVRYFTHNQSYSCEIRSWSLRFRQFDICQGNTAQSNALLHSIVPNKWSKFGAKIFRHYRDIAIFVLGYFILPHPV